MSERPISENTSADQLSWLCWINAKELFLLWCEQNDFSPSPEQIKQNFKTEYKTPRSPFVTMKLCIYWKGRHFATVMLEQKFGKDPSVKNHIIDSVVPH